MECPQCHAEIPAGETVCPACSAVVSSTDETLGSLGTAAVREAVAGDLSGMLAEADRAADFADRYEVLDEIGRGGMGRVYRARDRRLDRIVAIKRLLAEGEAEQRAIERFIREARAIAALSHYNIVNVFDIGRDDDGFYIAMEYVDAGTLRDLIQREDRVSVPRAVDLVKQLAEALQVAHEAGIVHRDLKPSNVLMTARGAPKIADFGLARMEAEPTGTVAGAVLGTLGYMAPEQRADSSSVDARADIYALGATFYAMVTGRPPRVIRSEDVPTEVRPIVMKAVEDLPADRYQTAADLADDLDAYLLKAKLAERAGIAAGACPSCGAYCPPDAHFCPACRASLMTPCYVCEAENRTGSKYCRQCGLDLNAHAEQKWREIAARQTKAQELRREFRYDEALQELEAVAAESHPEFASAADDARRDIEGVREEKAAADAERARHLAAIDELLADRQYRRAVQQAEAVPEHLQNEEVEDRLNRARGLAERVQELWERVRRDHESGRHAACMAGLDELLGLVPETDDLLALVRRVEQVYLRAEHDRAKGLMQEAGYDEAATIWRTLLGRQWHGIDVPRSGLEKNLAYAEKKRLVADVERQRDDLIRAGDWSAALEPARRLVETEAETEAHREALSRIEAQVHRRRRRVWVRNALIGVIAVAAMVLAIVLIGRVRERIRRAAFERQVEEIGRLLDAGRYDDARRAAETAAALDADDPRAAKLISDARRALLDAAKSKITAGDTADVRTALDGALALAPDDPEAKRLYKQYAYTALFNDIRRALAAERWADARSAADRAAAIDPTDTRCAELIRAAFDAHVAAATAALTAVDEPAATAAVAVCRLLKPTDAETQRLEVALQQLPPPVAPGVPTWARISQAQIDAAKQAGVDPAIEIDLDGDATMRMVLIPPGTFTMGSPVSEKSHRADEGPTHVVTISKPFYLGATEVTQGQWAGGRDKKVYPDLPASEVSWDDCEAFIQKLNARVKGGGFRLPTEAEWEYACRAGSQTRYCFGDDDGKLGDYAWHTNKDGKSWKAYAHAVGQKKPNAWGLYDMHGNVSEWCEDWYDKVYPGGQRKDPTGPAIGTTHVVRGGAFLNNPWGCRAAVRDGLWPHYRYKHLGFRVARSVEAATVRLKPASPTISQEQIDAAKKAGVEPAIELDLGGGEKMRMMLIPPGTFTMGSPASEKDRDSEDEGPEHEVTISTPFYISATEVTQGQWQAVMGTEPWKGQKHAKAGPEHAVHYVSWNDCQGFIRRVNEKVRKDGGAGSGSASASLRLPTEAEWEYTFRAGSQTRFYFGDDESRLGDYAWYCGNASEKGDKYPHAAAQKRPNVWGVYDMPGNVWEWCRDWYGAYPSGTATDPIGPATGTQHVVRGGSFFCHPKYCRAASRGGRAADYRKDIGGFRVARSIKAQDVLSWANVSRAQIDAAKEAGVEPAVELDLGGGVKMKMVLIPAGTFKMGSPASEADRQDDETQHEVTISKPFYVGKMEVTVGQFRRFVADSSYRTDAEKAGSAVGWNGTSWGRMNGASWENPGFDQGEDHPVTEVSWNDAIAFCRWLSRKASRTLRLPTEAEWEYACRAGTETAYQWGNDLGGGKGWCNGADLTAKEKVPSWPHFGWRDGFVFTAPVGSFRPNAWGVCDMHGNVWEWCSDRYGKYVVGKQVDPGGAATGNSRVLRGGGFHSRPWVCRSAQRLRDSPISDGYFYGGFRVVLDLGAAEGSGRDKTAQPAAAVPSWAKISKAQIDAAKKAGVEPAIEIDLGGGEEMKMVLIPAGTFKMGSPASDRDRDDDETQHEVTISKAFYMGVHEVTIGQFRTFVTDADYRSDTERDGSGQGWDARSGRKVKGASWQRPGYPQKDDHPVVCISHNDAAAFCAWLSKKAGSVIHLPTEAQWEYACRAGTQTAYQWGDDPDAGKGWCNGYDLTTRDVIVFEKFFNWRDGFVFTTPVGGFRPNAWGLYDMHGNVWEWCTDWYGEYPSGPAPDPSGLPTGTHRALRGGSWYTHPRGCRSAERWRRPPGIGNFRFGFRVMRTIAPSGADDKPDTSSAVVTGREWIVLSWMPPKSGRADVWLISPDGKTRKNLTNSPTIKDCQPALSPDGRRIAFSRRGDEETGGIFVWEAETNSVRRLVAPADAPFTKGNLLRSPVWISAGTLYYARFPRMGLGEVWRVDVDGKNRRLVFPMTVVPKQRDGVVTDISPDGRRLVLVAQAGKWAPTLDVYTCDLSGRRGQTVHADVPDEHRDSGPIWSPGGERIAWAHWFTAGAGSKPKRVGVALARSRRDGTWAVVMQPERDAFVMPLAWSPDGKQLLCADIDREPSAPEARATLFIMDSALKRVRGVLELDNWDWRQGGDWGRYADWGRLEG